ncbi:hypothetical protein NQ315_017037 [Exocentrus adspersus]|uniref:Uncharacterized protein n=1 Tax=Exocentrus adspersus TaxID=1586481 RepID=A0AAV8V5F0_9CUCU|nr:hypothetical protein NQ315_017037 [Exocentrus adspersus]
MNKRPVRKKGRSRTTNTRKNIQKQSQILCVLCCDKSSDDDLESIGDVMRHVLDVLLINAGHSFIERPAMCLKCSLRIKTMFEFKSACLYTEDFLTPFANIKKPDRIDIKNIYLREKGSKELIDVLSDRNLCRLCLSAVDNNNNNNNRTTVSLDAKDLHVNRIKRMIDRCIPEVNVDNTTNALICDACVNHLEEYCKFIDSCAEVRKMVESYCSKNGTNRCVALPEVLKFTSSNSSFKTEPDKDASGIKTEVEEIKSVSALPPPPLKLEKVRNQEFASYQCRFCDHISKRKHNLKSHMLIHKDPSEKKSHKCHLCDFKTLIPSCLKHHMLVHKDPSEIKWFECDLCDFKTKRNGSLTCHKLMHKDPSQIQWFQCHLCGYKVFRKQNLKKHMVVHQHPSQVKWITCKLCDFKTRHRSSLNNHMQNHKDPLEIKWYNCDLCHYKAKEKPHLNSHMLVHKDSSEVTWLKCEFCNYKGKYKSNLKTHMLKHKDSSEIKWFRCDICDYKAKIAANLRSHMSVHKDPSEIRWQECHLCGLKLKRKDTLKTHMRLHKSPSQINWFKCDLCGFKTRHKTSLKDHVANHRDPSKRKYLGGKRLQVE